jgi:hypothetical protein
MTKTNYSSRYCLNNPCNSEYIRHIEIYILNYAWGRKRQMGGRADDMNAPKIFSLEIWRHHTNT